MANRLTKGKALVGSLDVQGELTINGVAVGGGGGADVFTGLFNNNGVSSLSVLAPNSSLYDAWFGLILSSNLANETGATIQEGDKFHVKYTYDRSLNPSSAEPYMQMSRQDEHIVATAGYNYAFGQVAVIVSGLIGPRARAFSTWYDENDNFGILATLERY